MRVLIATWGWRTHFYPLVPLGWALQAAGHEVRVTAQPAMAGVVTGAGLTAVPIGRDLNFAEVFGGRVGRVAARGSDSGLPPVITPDGGVARYADALLDDLVTFGRAFRPDLIVYEPFNLAGSLAAAALGVPDVRLLWGPDSGTELDLDTERVLGRLALRVGVSVDKVNVAGSLTLDPCPAGMQVPLGVPTAPIRFVPYNGPAVAPDWLREPPARPRVCVTWGTMMAALGLTDQVDVARVVRAIAALDVEVVVAVDPRQRPELEGLPANVRLARSPLALHLLLPTCRVLVQQGGAGSTMTGLACGVPQLVLPLVSDQHFNATRLAAIGAGTQLPADRADPDAIRQRVAELLTDDVWWRRAQELRAEVRARPSPAEVVKVLHRRLS